MDKMKIGIWGAGIRGKRLGRSLGTDSICAYIDSDEKIIGKSIDEKEVLGYGEFIKKYDDAAIVLSMSETDQLESLLINEKRLFFLYRDMPGELFNQGRDIESFIKGIIDEIDTYRRDDKILIYGDSIYSIHLYLRMHGSGYTNLFLFSKRDSNFINLIKSRYGINIITESDDDCDYDWVMVTTSDYYGAILRYTNCKIEDFYNVSILHQNNKCPHLRRFSNIHFGKRCFIIGNGPSLKIDDLDIIEKNNDISFGVNMVYKAFENTRWRPNYYVVSDMEIIGHYWEEIINLNVSNKFIPGTFKSKLTSSDSNAVNLYNLCTQDWFDQMIPFSNDIERCIYGCATVLYICIQIAVYMGFEKIYIIGADCNYDKKVNHSKNYFIDNYLNTDDLNAAKRRFETIEAFRGYQSAKKYATEHGVSIYNATRGGMLEVFERVDFDELMQKGVDDNND